MEIRVLGFGVVREIFGAASVQVLSGTTVTVEELKILLEGQYPGLRKLTSFMIAVNSEYAAAGTVINAVDEVAIIPPVSGG